MAVVVAEAGVKATISTLLGSSEKVEATSSACGKGLSGEALEARATAEKVGEAVLFQGRWQRRRRWRSGCDTAW